MKTVIISALLFMAATAIQAQEPIAILKQGFFSVGGTIYSDRVHTITANSSAGQNKRKPDKATVPTTPSWTFRFLPTTSPYRLSMCMATVVQVSAGR